MISAQEGHSYDDSGDVLTQKWDFYGLDGSKNTATMTLDLAKKTYKLEHATWPHKVQFMICLTNGYCDKAYMVFTSSYFAEPVFSSTQDRSSAKPLGSDTIPRANGYLFIQDELPTDASYPRPTDSSYPYDCKPDTVHMCIDGGYPAFNYKKPLCRTEAVDPYDFAGTGYQQAPTPFDFSQLDPGFHYLNVYIRFPFFTVEEKYPFQIE